MSIEEEAEAPRRAIAWLGREPASDARGAFESRGLTIGPLSASVSNVAAVILTEGGKPRAFAEALRGRAENLMNQGCDLLAVTRWTTMLSKVLKEAHLPCLSAGVDIFHPYIRVIDPTQPVPWNEIANSALAWGRERRPSTSVDFFAAEAGRSLVDLGISPEDEVLLRRAFWDCREVHFEELNQGKSGATVLVAHAKLEHGWAAPYFLKISDRAEVIREYRNYREDVDPYIHFQLGPGLTLQRCCLGAHRGVLVGDFVDESESLVQCAMADRASSAISCLFHRTLRGWHGRDPKLTAESLGQYLERMRMMPLQPSAERLKRAQEIRAAPIDPAQLRTRIMESSATSEYREGQIHADLNARNIRVRNGDAVLIDFAESKRGPILLDLASLEASLIVSGAPKTARDRKELVRHLSEWRPSIDALYAHPLEMAPRLPAPTNEWAWLHHCTRQIRMHAREAREQAWAVRRRPGLGPAAERMQIRGRRSYVPRIGC